VRNAIVIAAAQRIKHYETAIYGATTEFARVLGRDEDARKLEKITEDERAEEQQLSNIAERINPSAKKAA
jgi:ferritin-like metal-binding protein YciE